MTELPTPELAIGGIALAAAILYGAWYEFQVNNPRDAKLLASVGVAALIGSAFAWMN